MIMMKEAKMCIKFKKEDIQRQIGKEFLLLGEYKNIDTKMKIKHISCGTIFENTPYYVRKNKSCPVCNKNFSGGRRFEAAKVYQSKLLKEIFPEDEYIIDLSKFENVHSNITITHLECGESQELSVVNAKKRPYCRICRSKDSPYNPEIRRKSLISRLKKKYKGEWELVGDFVNRESLVEFRHKPCGTVISRTSTNMLFRDAIQKCPICKIDKNKRLFNKIRTFLTKNKIQFVCEKQFKNLRYKRPLKIDFYLPEYNLSIEADGQQHFYENSYDNSSLTDNIIRDRIKNEWHLKNKVSMLRFNFKHRLDVIDILTEIFLDDNPDMEKLIQRYSIYYSYFGEVSEEIYYLHANIHYYDLERSTTSA